MRCRSYFFYTATALAFRLYAAQNSPVALLEGKDFNLVLHIHNDNIAYNAPVATAQQIAPPQSLKKTSLFKKVQKLHAETQLKERMQTLLNSHSFLCDYGLYILALSLAGTYGYLSYIIYRGNSYLSNSELWSSWRQDLSFDQLLAIPQHQLSEDLIREIQRRYTNPSSVTDLLHPLTQFITIAADEEEMLLWYQKWYGWLSTLHIIRCLPFAKNRFAKITERMQRLTYFKNLFQTWIADYQLHHTPTGHRGPTYRSLNEIAQLKRKIQDQSRIFIEEFSSHVLPPFSFYFQSENKKRSRDIPNKSYLNFF